jgi:predicted hydrolase (HD superfamily)
MRIKITLKMDLVAAALIAPEIKVTAMRISVLTKNQKNYSIFRQVKRKRK